MAHTLGPRTDVQCRQHGHRRRAHDSAAAPRAHRAASGHESRTRAAHAGRTMIARGPRIELQEGVVQDWLEHAARTNPDGVAVVAGALRLSYYELRARARALASTLTARGVEPGDRVIVFGDNTVETVVGFWAVISTGAAAVIVSALARA